MLELKETYNINYIIQYSNLLQELNKYKRNYKTILKLEVYNNLELIDTFTYDSYVDSVDVLNFLKETYYYNDCNIVKMYEVIENV